MGTTPSRAWSAAFCLAVCVSGGCHEEPDTVPPGAPAAVDAVTADGDDEARKAALARLRAFERERRAGFDFTTERGAQTRLGPDPYAIVAAQGGFVGVERGADRVVALDRDLGTISAAPVARSPTGLTLGPEGDIYVASESSGDVQRFRLSQEGQLTFVEAMPTGLDALRDIALVGSTLIALSPRGELAMATRRGFRKTEVVAGDGAFRLMPEGDFVAALSLFEHRARIFRVDGEELHRCGAIVHDGPLWSIAMAPDPLGGMAIAVGGVEDRPLQRIEGQFGYIDSYVTLYRFDASARESCRPGSPVAIERLWDFNTSAKGVVTPKSIDLRFSSAGELELFVTGYGGDRALTLTWAYGQSGSAPRAREHALVPGVQRGVFLDDGWWFANPLLDAWVAVREGAVQVVRAEPDTPRAQASILGEALAFTTLIAPENPTEGSASRFTCETCHFEGTVDGRTHHTGREEVYATTKPLLGLFNNAPHFTRALDPDLTKVAHAEFRVAGKGSPLDPWFSVSASAHPWLVELGLPADAVVDPETLRKSLMSFLIDFGHRPNWRAASREGLRFDPQEREGASLFEQLCEGCHAARLIASDPTTRIPPSAWESSILSTTGPIVWARDGYERTGVEPYVHPDGARTTSLRRVGRKAPLFTNGSAESLDELLRMVLVTEDRVLHDGAIAAPGQRRLSPEEVGALEAFLLLL